MSIYRCNNIYINKKRFKTHICISFSFYLEGQSSSHQAEECRNTTTCPCCSIPCKDNDVWCNEVVKKVSMEVDVTTGARIHASAVKMQWD